MIFTVPMQMRTPNVYLNSAICQKKVCSVTGKQRCHDLRTGTCICHVQNIFYFFYLQFAQACKKKD